MGETNARIPDARRLAVGVLSGSPRRGACAHLAREVVAPAVEEAGCEVRVSELRLWDVAPCVGCGACERTGVCVLARREAAGGQGRPGFVGLVRWLDALDALVLVAPLYFAGPPAPLKAALDRLQFLWSRRYLLGGPPALPPGRRRPLALVVVGAGGDPFGSSPLVTCVRSALHMADFSLVQTAELIGYRTGDASFEARAAACAAEAAREAQARGPFERRAAIDPLAWDGPAQGRPPCSSRP